MNVVHWLSRLRIRTMRKARVSRFLAREMAGGPGAAGLFLHVWIPLLRYGMQPKVCFSRFGRQAEFWPKSYYDLEVWRDVFEDGDFEINLPTPPELILDLGAHVGLTTMYYAMKYPGATVIAVEAEPSNYRQLIKNTAQFENVHAYHYAICDEDRPVALHIHPRSVSHSLVERSDKGTTTLVQGRSLDSLLEEHGIERVDLIKFNIEGMEFAMLEGFSRRTEVGAYLGYFHFDLAPEYEGNVGDLFDGYTVTRKPSKPMRSKIYAVKRDLNE